jgi:hypothetical protein
MAHVRVGHVPAGHTVAVAAQGLADRPRGLKILTEAHEAGTEAKNSHWFCAG